MLNENANLKIELNQQTQDYQQLAQERNKLVLQQIKNINVEELHQLVPQVEKAIIKQFLEKTSNYEELSQKRSEFIMKHINQSQLQQQQSLSTQISLIQKEEASRSEKIILISLLVVSLISVGGLLVKLQSNSFKLKGANTKKEK